MDVAAYLERFGCPGPHAPDAATLGRLHLAHLRAVPFENLDITLGRPIELDLERLFDKIVRRRRGGFCYELNGLFAWLLGRLGYRVQMLSGRVWGETDFGPEFDHMLLLVDLAGPVVADVGFGDSFLLPRPLDAVPRQEHGRSYRFVGHGAGHALERRVGAADWQPQYCFTTQPRALADFAPMCRWQQTAPESVFTGKTVCSRATADGRVTLAGGRLIVTRGEAREERAVQDLAEWSDLLLRDFAIRIPADELVPAVLRPPPERA